jgi:hypothetical protein
MIRTSKVFSATHGIPTLQKEPRNWSIFCLWDSVLLLPSQRSIHVDMANAVRLLLTGVHSSPAPLAEPPILPLIPLVARNAEVAPLHALGIDLVLGREEAGVVVAVESLLEVWDEGPALW